MTRHEVRNHLASCLEQRRRCFLITSNVDHLITLQDSAPFQEAYQKADLIVPDGVPLLWAARLLGRQLPERVAGSDLIFDLCRIAAQSRSRIYLLGGRPGVAAKAAQAIQTRFAGATVAGVECPPSGFEHEPAKVNEIVGGIRSSRADLLFVGLGSPKQEIFLARHWAELGVSVGLGIGIALEFLAGTLRRAPSWMQTAGIEWLWRLHQEPGRLWKRYLVRDPKFLWLIAKQRLAEGHELDRGV